MNIDYLRYFLDVAETKSITQAARLNFISPQGMSRAMAELEKEFDCKLLERFPNKLGLTKHCERLLPAIKDVVASYDELVHLVGQCQTADALGDDAPDTLHLLCQPICSFCFFPTDIMDALLHGSEIQCLEADNRAIFDELAAAADRHSAHPGAGTMGLTCLFGPKRATAMRAIRELEGKGYRYRPFLASYDMVMVSADSPLAGKDTLDDADILGQAIITSNSELHDSVAQLFGESAITMTSGNVGFRHQMVARGEAVSFMPAISMLDWHDETTVLKPFDSRYDIELGFIGTDKDFEHEAFDKLATDLLAWYSAHADADLFTLLWK